MYTLSAVLELPNIGSFYKNLVNLELPVPFTKRKIGFMVDASSAMAVGASSSLYFAGNHNFDATVVAGPLGISLTVYKPFDWQLFRDQMAEVSAGETVATAAETPTTDTAAPAKKTRKKKAAA